MIIHKGKNSFYIVNEQQHMLAHIDYSFEDATTLSADSTFVDPSLRGQGIAKQLLDRLVQYARDNGYAIRPRCWYVVRAFNENAAYEDVKRT